MRATSGADGRRPTVRRLLPPRGSRIGRNPPTSLVGRPVFRRPLRGIHRDMSTSTGLVRHVHRYDLLDESGRRIGGLVCRRASWSPGATLTLSRGEMEVVRVIPAAHRAPDEGGSLVLRYVDGPPP